VLKSVNPTLCRICAENCGLLVADKEANVNELTGLEHFDPLSGFPWLRALPARVEKKRG
jgi:hypothetical protein